MRNHLMLHINRRRKYKIKFKQKMFFNGHIFFMNFRNKYRCIQQVSIVAPLFEHNELFTVTPTIQERHTFIDMRLILIYSQTGRLVNYPTLMSLFVELHESEI